MSGEVECGRRALSGKASGLLQCVDIFHQTIRLLQVVEVTRKWIVDALGTLDQSGKILGGDICRNVGGLKLGVDTMLSGISVGIRANPAVVLDRSVQRLRTVGNVMTEPAGIKDDRLLHRLRRLVRRQPLPVFSECGLQSAINFHRNVRLQANALGQVVVGMLRSRD